MKHIKIVCRLLVGFEPREAEFAVPHEGVPSIERVLLAIAKLEEWPTGPITFDVWELESPLIIHGKLTHYITLEFCQHMRDERIESLKEASKDDSTSPPDV